MKKPSAKPAAKSAKRPVKKPPAKKAAVKKPVAKVVKVEPQNEFEILTDKAAQGILIHTNFKPLYVNMAFATLLGHKSRRDVLDMPILRPLFLEESWAQVEHDYDDLVNGGKAVSVLRMPLCHKNGSEVWVTGTQHPVEWRGAPAVQVSLFDITAQVKVEQSLLRTEQLLRAVLEILPYPIYIARRSDGRLLFVNRKSCLLFQRGASALLRGTSIDFFANPKEREDLRALFDTIDDIRDGEVKMRTASGREFMAELSAIKMEYNGEPSILVAVKDISERKALEAELLRQASTDPLTGIANRRSFMAQAEQEMRRSRRFNRPLSVMMLDLDHFKPVNDKHGHAVGDAVLQGVVRSAGESLRQSDLLARLGGEEFAALLPETSLASGAEVADRLRIHLAERPIIAEGVAISCTVSIGIAELTPDDKSVDEFLNRADQALYRAKENGRNRVERA